MVLVDTSVWVRALAGRQPEASALSRLLEAGDVLRHDLIHGELLVGDTGARRVMLEAYAAIPSAQSIRHGEVVELVRARRLAGRGIGWIDAHLLASALVERCALWTADSSLAAIAVELDVGHEIR